MESQSEIVGSVPIEELIIQVGRWLNASPTNSITEIDSWIISDIILVLHAELDRREATTH
jgi:hypothetical protein|tara:strand:- start:257 stop:436 length:180 start_codon:yes stop_codon:yes gene_type:complete